MLPIICRSTPFSTKPTRVARNQHQSENREARSPSFLPRRPSLDHVAISSARELTSSSSTGGGAWSTVCKKGFGTFLVFSEDCSEENGTVCCSKMAVKGPSQLNRSSSFLRYDNLWDSEILVGFETNLVKDNPEAVDCRRFSTSNSNGDRVGLRSSRLVVIDKWNTSPSRMEYWISFWFGKFR